MQEQATESTANLARKIASDYIQKNKQWEPDAFTIEIVSDRDKHKVVVDAVHRDDLKGNKGSNKSVQLHVNTATRRVVKELAYQ